jgi:hypothetical protein
VSFDCYEIQLSNDTKTIYQDWLCISVEIFKNIKKVSKCQVSKHQTTDKTPWGNF